jgi:hypothetical protein
MSESKQHLERNLLQKILKRISVSLIDDNSLQLHANKQWCPSRSSKGATYVVLYDVNLAESVPFLIKTYHLFAVKLFKKMLLGI